MASYYILVVCVLGKIVSVKAKGKTANPEFARKLEKSMEQILRGEYVRLEDVLEEEEKPTQA